MASNTSQDAFTNHEYDVSYCYHIVWLDANLNNSSNRQRFKQLKEIDSHAKGFTCQEECIDYIQQQNDRNTISYIIFIVSGTLSANIIPIIQDYISILIIFIFCTNIDNYKHLKFSKLRAICNDTYELIDNIEIYIAKHSNRTDISVFQDQYSTNSESQSSQNKSKDQCIIRNLKEDQASFLWFNQMHKFMINLKNDDDIKAKEEMINHSRKQYDEQAIMQLRINRFNNQSLTDNKQNAILWYTENAFIHQCTNAVLRRQNISQVYLYRYIIKILCHQLKEEHKHFIHEYNRSENKKSLRLYRGQYLKVEQICFLNNNKDILISLNGFVSTTKDKDIAMQFIRYRSVEDAEPVLFIIDVDMTSEHCVPFADISKYSKFPLEKEVLLSIGSIFRVKSVKIDNQQQLYKIHLSLSQHNQLRIIKYIEQTYADNIDSSDHSILFGKLLFEIGETQSAIKYFSTALDHLSDNNNKIRATYLNNIGVCLNEIGKKDEALRYCQSALRIYEQIDNKQGWSACQHNIASFYHAKGDHQVALNWALKALEMRQTNKIEQASTLNLLGCIQLSLRDVEAAYNNFAKALKLRLKYLSEINPYHPDIGVSYQNLGKVLSKSANYIDAETNYLQAAEIYRHNYPETNPLVIEITKCLKSVHQQWKY